MSMIAKDKALRDEFLPEDLVHRDGEVDTLTAALQPVADGYAAATCGIFGPSGAGKTTLARYICDHLEDEALHVRVGKVNCLGHSTAQDALYTLLVSAGVTVPPHRSGVSTGELLDRLRAVDGHIVAIFDEVDVLADPGLLHSLYAIDGCSLVVVTIGKREWFDSLSNRTLRRMRTARTVHLEPYSHDELLDILERRAGVGVSGRVTDAAMDRMATLADGDARYGIALLRHAAEHCRGRDRPDRVTTEVVDSVADDVSAALAERYIERLGTHPRAIYEIIREAGEIRAETLRDKYEATVANPRSDAQRRRYLNSLERYGRIESKGSTRDRVYRLATQ